MTLRSETDRANLDPHTLNRQELDHQTLDREEWLLAALARFERRLCLYAARLLGDAERARDIVQETFLRLCSERRSHVDGHLGEWLFTVCKHRALDVRAKENSMQTTVKNAMELQLHETADGRDSRRLDPAQIAEQSEEQGRVAALLERLPANQREVLYLKFQQGLSYKEIGKVTGHSVSNVGFLIHTGMKTLRGKVASDDRVAKKKDGTR